jgi:hypothetical protein
VLPEAAGLQQAAGDVEPSGTGLATAGIVLGWIGIAILVAGVILIAFHPAK